jgi:hypothetical protein
MDEKAILRIIEPGNLMKEGFTLNEVLNSDEKRKRE